MWRPGQKVIFVNMDGDAISIGHPYFESGNRMVAAALIEVL
jgi:acetyl-CoA acetyltransferase